MSANRVTMRDVAKEAGVTSAAVSYALSGKRPISEETRRRVEQAIERLGYTPNMAARTLGSARQDSRLIGVVVPQRLEADSCFRTSFTLRYWEALNCAPDRKATM